MNVTCPTCSTVFRVDPAKVPAGGVRARCSVCRGTFAVGMAEPASAPAPAFAPPPPPPPVAVAAPPVMVPAPAPTPVMPALLEQATVVRPAITVPPPAAPRPSINVPAAPGLARPSVSMAPSAAPPMAPRPAAPAAPFAPPPRPAAPLGPPPRPAAPAAPAAPVAPPAAATPAAPPRPPLAPPAAPGRVINPFLQKDPVTKAQRLARALVSDMVSYHPAKRNQGLKDGNLKEIFREEVKKSYEEYVLQVGEQLASTTTFFQDALNEILAGGQKIF